MMLPASAGARMAGLSWDNDATFGTDGAYSNGLRLSWLGDEFSATDCADCTALRLADRLRWLPGFALRTARHSLNVNVEQLMITPHDISIEPEDGDFPYAGILRVELGMFSRQLHALTGYHLVLGVIGPNSGAGSLQYRVHDWAGVNLPQGWDEQLGEDPVVGVAAAHTRLLRQWGQDNGLQGELSVNWRIRADTVSVLGHAGSFIRFGRNLPGNQLPEYAGLGSSASLPGLFLFRDVGWSLFAGVAAEATAWSYIAEHAPGDSFDSKRFVAIGTLGAAAHTSRIHVSFTMRKSTSHTVGLRRPFQYATFAAVVRF